MDKALWLVLHVKFRKQLFLGYCNFIYFFKRCIYLFYVYEYNYSCLQTHQKRASEPITDGYELSCGCWELNSGSLEEQSVLLSTEASSLQPDFTLRFIFFSYVYSCMCGSMYIFSRGIRFPRSWSFR